MIELAPNSRAALGGAALFAFAAAFATLPNVARGADGSVAADVQRPATPTSAPAAGDAPPRVVVPVVPIRDPFAGGGLTPAARAPTTAQLGAGVLAPPQVMPVVPTPPPVPAPSRVTAIVTGARPFALLDDAGATRVVTVGDAIDGQRVVSVAIDGVHLTHGITLPLTPALAPSKLAPNGER